MEPAPLHVRSHPPPEARRPVLSPQFGRANVQITPRPDNGQDDDANTSQTIELMREFAAADANTPQVQAATRQATQGAQGSAAARSIFEWIKARVRFQEDATTALLAGLPEPDSAEVLIRPADILRMPQPAGDCDDFTMLAVSMLSAAGLPARIKAIEQDEDRPGFFSHVFAETHIDGAWRAFDTSHGSEIGWSATPTGKVKTWEVQSMAALGAIPQLGAFDWGGLIRQGMDITGQILVPRLSVPQTPGGSYTRLPNGSVVVANQPTGGQFTFPGGSAATIGGDNSGTYLLIGAAAIVGLIMLTKR